MTYLSGNDNLLGYWPKAYWSSYWQTNYWNIFDSSSSTIVLGSNKITMLESFLSEDVYLGLWSLSGGNILSGNTLDLPTFSSNYELTTSFKYYVRVKIKKSTWLIHPLEFYAYPNFPVQFLASSDWNNLGGYFISTTADNSGKLICYDTFKSQGEDINVVEGNYLTIYPKIRIY